MTLSNTAERVLVTAMKNNPGAGFTVVERGLFSRTTRPKDIAHHCFHKGILFFWSERNYYFQHTGAA